MAIVKFRIEIPVLKSSDVSEFAASTPFFWDCTLDGLYISSICLRQLFCRELCQVKCTEGKKSTIKTTSRPPKYLGINMANLEALTISCPSWHSAFTQGPNVAEARSFMAAKQKHAAGKSRMSTPSSSYSILSSILYMWEAVLGPGCLHQTPPNHWH